MHEFGSAIADRVYELLCPVIANSGLELIDVEWKGTTLRLTIDADGGISTANLVEVNRLVSPILDQHDPVAGKYMLEVTSPGVERNLRRLDHYRKAVGELVAVKLVAGEDPRRITGKLQAVNESTITVMAHEFDGVGLAAAEEQVLSLAVIDRARTIFDWEASLKQGLKNGDGGSKRQKKRTQA